MESLQTNQTSIILPMQCAEDMLERGQPSVLISLLHSIPIIKQLQSKGIRVARLDEDEIKALWIIIEEADIAQEYEESLFRSFHVKHKAIVQRCLIENNSAAKFQGIDLLKQNNDSVQKYLIASSQAFLDYLNTSQSNSIYYKAFMDVCKYHEFAFREFISNQTLQLYRIGWKQLQSHFSKRKSSERVNERKKSQKKRSMSRNIPESDKSLKQKILKLINKY